MTLELRWVAEPNIKNKNKIDVGTVRLLISRVLKPAVRVVTDWKYDWNHLSKKDNPDSVLLNSRK